MNNNRSYWCERCSGYCSRRRSVRRRDGVEELWETTTHKDGKKSTACYGKVNAETQQILAMQLI